MATLTLVGSGTGTNPTLLIQDSTPTTRLSFLDNGVLVHTPALASGTATVHTLTAGITASSGSSQTYINILINSTYNLTSTFTGTVIGIDYNPTNTSLVGTTHLAFRAMSGGVYFKNDSIGVTQSDLKGILIENTTAAAAGAQQQSPSFTWSGQGWKTTATAASQNVKVTSYLLPVQGTANPTSTWVLGFSINGGAYSNVLTLTSASLMTLTGTSSAIVASSSMTISSFGGGNAMTFNVSASNFIFNAGSLTATTSTLATTSTIATTGTIVHDYFKNTATLNASSTGQFTFINPVFTVTAYGGAVTGYDWNPTTPANITGTHLAFRATSGSVLIGGTSLTNSSTILDLQSTTKAMILTRIGTEGNITAPVNGMLYYNSSSNVFRGYQNGWVTLGSGGGITNSAAANELMLSDGTNAVPSGLFVSGNTLTFGNASNAGTSRLITTNGSASDVDLTITPKGSGSLYLLGTSYQITSSSMTFPSGGLITGVGPLQITAIGDLIVGEINGFGTAPNVSIIGNGGTLAAGLVNITGASSVTTGVASGSVVIASGLSSTGNADSGNIYLNIGGKAGTGKFGNIGLLTASGSFGGGEKVIFINNATTIPSTNPTGGGILYASGGALYWLGTTTGTPTKIANA